ncbi:MAG: hypothetical protein E6H79_06950 [Betaproteobacteria bacterium]|nr:MAG: hypothetical protein E6H79_06950 [Betaproteobacteria bacterium]
MGIRTLLPRARAAAGPAPVDTDQGEEQQRGGLPEDRRPLLVRLEGLAGRRADHAGGIRPPAGQGGRHRAVPRPVRVPGPGRDGTAARAHGAAVARLRDRAAARGVGRRDRRRTGPAEQGGREAPPAARELGRRGGPEGLRATLRPYQQRGYAWLWRNTRLGLGSVIADDMGLGKTLQVIALLQRLKEDGALDEARTLVVVPTSLLTNWQKEPHTR